MVNLQTNTLSPDAFKRFWDEKGEPCVNIIKAMTQKDVWQLDDELKEQIEAILVCLENGDVGANLGALANRDYIEVMGWLSTEKSLMLLSEFENASKGFTEGLLNSDNAVFGDAFKIFVERISAFSRAKLLAEIFDQARIERIEKAARVALRAC